MTPVSSIACANAAMQESKIREILDLDPIWSAYALADLAPQHTAFCQWHHSAAAVVLAYLGLTPPVFFATGHAEDVVALAAQVPPGEYQFTLLPEHRFPLDPILSVQSELQMWRMSYKGDSPEIDPSLDTRRLSEKDLDSVVALFADHTDRPDAFHARQLEEGPFFGAFLEEELVAVAGVHVLSESASMAALGNVFTHPEHRGQGFGRNVSAQVIRGLRRMDIQTIVLNVAKEHTTAVGLYQALGFQHHCGYYEGLAELHTNQ
ncbi:MAG: GNAT family N-acetyltransferase [Anaerolineales bacterium]|nr:GNAT family N-acetyltransferase [Anaerolineales bacterium]